MRAVHIAGFALLCAIWGSTWLAIRITVETIPPLRAAGIRFAVAGALVAVLIGTKRMPMPLHREMWSLVVLSISMIALPYGLLFWAERRIPSSTTAVLFSSLPLVTSLLTPFMGQHRVPRRALYAMLFALGGILVIFSSALAASLQLLLGGIAILCSVVSCAWGTLYAKRTMRNVHPVVSTAVQLVLGAVFLLVAAFFLERGQHAQWTHSALGAMAFLVLFGSIIAFSVFYWLLRYMRPYQLATVQLIVPIVAIFEGAAFGREHVPLTIIGAAALIIGSVAAVLTARDDEDAILSITSPVREHA